MLCDQVSRRELTNLRTYKGTVSLLVERVSKIRQVLPQHSYYDDGKYPLLLLRAVPTSLECWPLTTS